MIEAVFDASALLALLLGELGSDTLVPVLNHAVIGAVNLAEVQTKLIDLGPQFTALRASASDLLLRTEPFTAEQALVAANLRIATRGAGLSLGDRACLALALSLNAEVYTSDQAWRRVKVGCTINFIR